MGFWTCRGCKRKRQPGLKPCKECSGYTANKDNHVTGVTDAWGMPAGRQTQRGKSSHRRTRKS